MAKNTCQTNMNLAQFPWAEVRKRAENYDDQRDSWLPCVSLETRVTKERHNGVKDDKTEENTFEILQHSDININNS